MHFTSVIFTAILACGALASPNPPPKPAKPTPTEISQNNYCGNNVQPYCCTADGHYGYSSCYAMGGASFPQE